MSEWVYGRNPVHEVLRAGRRKVSRLLVVEGAQSKGQLPNILEICSRKNIPIETAPRPDLDRIQPGNQGLLLETSPYPYTSLADIFDHAQQRAEAPLILVLDTLQDPQNLGTLLRTAEIVGVHGVLLPLRRTATVTPAVVNASSGASEHLLVTQINLAQAINSLEADIVKAIMADTTRGGYAETTEVVGSSPFFWEDSSIGGRIIIFSVIYEVKESDPYRGG